MGVVCNIWPKVVAVRDYVRFRLGRWEHVKAHCRGLPSPSGQTVLNFTV